MKMTTTRTALMAVLFCMPLCAACAEGWETDGSFEPNTDEPNTDDDQVTQEPEPHTRSKIQLSTADGQDSDELTAKCHGFLCLSGQTLDTNIHFVLPAGYRKDDFSKSVDPSISAGGFADWANDDPYDATIHLHAWADALSSCTVKVWGVTAVED